jgi:hypothetical protein
VTAAQSEKQIRPQGRFRYISCGDQRDSEIIWAHNDIFAIFIFGEVDMNSHSRWCAWCHSGTKLLTPRSGVLLENRRIYSISAGSNVSLSPLNTRACSRFREELTVPQLVQERIFSCEINPVNGSLLI